MKKNIEVYEGEVKVKGGDSLHESTYFVVDDKPIDSIMDAFEHKRVRITIEELEEKE